MAKGQWLRVVIVDIVLIAFPGSVSATNRTAMWWLASYSSDDAAENAQAVAAASGMVGAILHCCTGPNMAPNGSIVTDAAQTQAFRTLVAADRAAAPAAPIFFPLSPNTAAVLSGVAANGISSLLLLAEGLGCDGFVVDYEPHTNATQAHAEAFAGFLAKLSGALHSAKLRLYLCVSDWGVLNDYSVLARANADLYISMSDTYGGQAPGYILQAKLAVKRMQATFPRGTVAVGIGTVAPAACHCLFGNTGNCTGDYAWTQASLSSFLSWIGSQGIDQLAVWRTDIYPRYCTSGGGIEAWMYSELRRFVSGDERTYLMPSDRQRSLVMAAGRLLK